MFCPLCPGWYNVSAVIAKSSDPDLEDRPWSSVMLRKNEHSIFPVRRGKPVKERATILSQGWKPYCPACGKLLPETTHPVHVIGIIGNYNSSKSHYIAGLAYELTTKQPLRSLGVDVSHIPGAGVSMDAQINLIYAKREVLPHTERGSAYGPYIYELTRRSGGLVGSSVLAFFDVAGEDATSHIESAKLARYIFHATGIVLLLDPDGLPREGSTLEAIDPNTRLITRELVDSLAYLIQQATGESPREREQQLVVAMAKADKLRLPEGLYPPPSLNGASRKAIKKQLSVYSQECAEYMASIGAHSIVDAAYGQFGPAKVHFAMVSATGEEPKNGAWVSPAPQGCSLPITQILLSRGSGA